MSLNQNNPVLIKSVQHTNRFLNATNLTNLSNNNTMFNLQNNGRKFSKSVSISNSLNPTNLPSNSSSLSSYQYHYSNTTNNNNNSNSTTTTNNSTNSNNNFTNSSNFPSMIKNSMTPSFASTRKFTTDYQQAGKFLFILFFKSFCLIKNYFYFFP